MQKISFPLFYSGLSGLQLPLPKYLFPPPFENSSRLTYYSHLFNSIEVNSSFYKIPQSTTVARWKDSVTENFKFTFKLWNGITHGKEFIFHEADVSAFIKSIDSVGEKCGCLLIQFPPGLGKEFTFQLDKLLNCIRESETIPWKIAVEFRNKSWYNSTTYSLLNSFGSALVIHDIPKSATPMVDHVSDFIYARFHGPTGNYRESYTEDFLEEYASYILEWMKEGKEVYVYFNNTMGDAFNNLNKLNSIIHKNQSGISI